MEDTTSTLSYIDRSLSLLQKAKDEARRKSHDEGKTDR